MGGANTQLKSGSYTYDLRLSKDGSLEATLVKD